MEIREALTKLNEINELAPRETTSVAVIDDDINAKLLKKIKIIADALKHAFEAEGINLDAQLVADDIIRDCGLMGGVVDASELDVEHNPFDAATKQMHDMGPVDTNRACQMLLAVEPHEFVSVFMNGLRRNRGLLPAGARGALPLSREPKRIGRMHEKKEKDYSYIDDLAKKFSAEIKECKEDLHEEDKPAPKSIEDCQKWIDYDMKHYGKISDETNEIIKKAGFQIIKDEHGDYEVAAGKFENLEEDKEMPAPEGVTFDLSGSGEPVEVTVKDGEIIDAPEDLKTFDAQMDFLAKDEQEAIDGYDKVIMIVEDEHVKEQLEHIKEEEIAHRDFLEAVKKDRSLVYSHEDKEEEEEEVELEVVEEELLTEKITDLKGYYNSPRNKERFQNVGLDEKRFMQIVALDPTYKEGSNKAGDYVEWLLRMITTGTMTYKQMMDIGQEWKDALGIYTEYKRKNKLPADKRDIMRFKNFDDFFSFLQSLGGDIVVDAEEGTSFHQAIKNIRGALVSICGFRDEDIPEDIQKTEDALTFCGATDKWELYRIESIWGAMLADTYGIDWGAGATWCTGGQYSFVGEPRKGQELLRSASNHYPHYTSNGTHLFFFAQKDNSVLRPKNKVQLQLKSDGYTVENVFHANDGPIRLDSEGKVSYSGGYGGSSDTSTVFAAFLQEEGLLEMVKNSPLGGCESIKDAENLKRLEAGEAYIYSGERIKQVFKSAIKKVVFTEDYSTTVKVTRASERVEVVGIPDSAFSGCTELEIVEMPIEIRAIGFNAFKGCDKVKIMTPQHRIICYSQNSEFLKEHVVYTDEEKPKAEEKPEEKSQEEKPE